MANIVLIETGLSNARPNPINRGNAAPPFALENLAGYLKKFEDQKPIEERNDVRIIVQEQLKKEEIPNYNGNDLKISPEVIVEMLQTMKEPIIVGIRAVSPLFIDALEVARKVKDVRPEAKVVIGGYHASSAVELEEGAFTTLLYKSRKYNKWETDLKGKHPGIQLVDCFVAGEGEQVLKELVDKWADPENLRKTNTEVLKDIPGVTYRDVETNKEKVNPDLFRLGENKEGRKYYDAEIYRKITIPIRDQQGTIESLREIPSSVGRLQTGTEIPHYNIREIQSNYTRGCPHECAFCASVCVWKKNITFRDPKKVVAEAAKLNFDPEYRINYIYFADLTFNMASTPLLELAHSMQNVRVRDNGEVYFTDELSSEDKQAGLDSGRKVFGHENQDQIHWFGLAQVFRFVEDGEKVEANRFGTDIKNEDAFVSRVGDLLDTFPDEFLTELGYVGDHAFSDFCKDLAENASHLYDNMEEALSDRSKEFKQGVEVDPEISELFGDQVKKEFAELFFKYLGFPERETMDPKDLIREMREAGCSKLGFGIEGFSLTDIVQYKNLDKRISGSILDNDYSEKSLRDRGIERFAQTALTLRTCKKEGMWTRGYFIWGSESQNEYTFDRAKLLLSLELPDKLLDNYGALKEATAFLFDEIEKYYPEKGEPTTVADFEDAKKEVQQAINQYLTEHFREGELVLTEADLTEEARSRYLDIDHLRIGYETPYLSTETAKTREMRCAEAYKNSEDVLIRDEFGKLVYKRTLSFQDQIVELDCRMDNENKARYYYPKNELIDQDKRGQEVKPGSLKEADYIIDQEITGEIFQEYTRKGGDDFQYLFQETPVLKCDVPFKDMVVEPSELVEYFHSCPEYRRSVERRIRQFPEQKEACYAWDKFWEDAKDIQIIGDDVRQEVIDKILVEAKAQDLDQSRLEYWLRERLTKEYQDRIPGITQEIIVEREVQNPSSPELRHV